MSKGLGKCVRYNGALFHTFYYYWAEKFPSFIRYIGFRYIGVPLYFYDITSNIQLSEIKDSL